MVSRVHNRSSPDPESDTNTCCSGYYRGELKKVSDMRELEAELIEEARCVICTFYAFRSCNGRNTAQDQGKRTRNTCDKKQKEISQHFEDLGGNFLKQTNKQQTKQTWTSDVCITGSGAS